MGTRILPDPSTPAKATHLIHLQAPVPSMRAWHITWALVEMQQIKPTHADPLVPELQVKLRTNHDPSPIQALSPGP